MILEACVDTLEEAMRAEQQGAHRIELCSRLDLDGLTPDLALTQKVREAIKIPIHVMIRPMPNRFPDVFWYDESQIEEMIASIERFKQLDIQGFVAGALDQNRMPDQRTMSRLAKATKGYNLTFHKAIDLAADPVAALQGLKTVEGVTHVLTSGGASSASAGVPVLREMIRKSGSIRVIAAGGVTDQNLTELHEQLGASEYHGKRIVGNLC